jgi:DNA-binding response OmpR family regulator
MGISASTLIVTSDMSFAQPMQAILQRWGMAVSLANKYEELPAGGVDVVLLDIRQQEGIWFPLLSIIRRQIIEAEVILMNRPGNVLASILGMQAGANDEIISPFDTGILKDKISAVVQRRDKRKTKKSLSKRFEDTMTAITFAQAGEYEIAVDVLQEKNEQQRFPKL